MGLWVCSWQPTPSASFGRPCELKLTLPFLAYFQRGRRFVSHEPALLKHMNDDPDLKKNVEEQLKGEETSDR